MNLCQFPFTDQVRRPANQPARQRTFQAAGQVERVCEEVVTQQHAGLVIPT